MVAAALALAAPRLAEAGQRPPSAVIEAAQQAQAAYEGGRYAEAADAYRRILASGWSSLALYYNLGCASFKAGQIGYAVGFFEEARRIAPRDADVRHNLQVALAQKRDRIENERPSWLLGLLAGVLDGYTPADAVTWLLVLFWAICLGAAVWWTVGGRAGAIARRALPALGVLGIVAAGALGLKAYQVSSAPSGVVVAEEAQVLAGPRAGETVHFVLHEGTLVYLGRQAGDWREVWLSDQMRGWVARESLMALQPTRWLP